MILNCTWGWGFSPWALGECAVLLHAITSRDTLTGSGNTGMVPNCGSHSSVGKLLVLDRNTWNHKKVGKKSLLSKRNHYLCGFVSLLSQSFCSWPLDGGVRTAYKKQRTKISFSYSQHALTTDQILSSGTGDIFIRNKPRVALNITQYTC